jgi:hypothetical protein
MRLSVSRILACQRGQALAPEAQKRRPDMDRRLGTAQLREYLRGLTPENHALLPEKIERDDLCGNPVPNANFLLTEMRQSVRNSEGKSFRIGSPSHVFFNPIESFIFDSKLERMTCGRIDRRSLNSILIWICWDLVPKEAKAFTECVTRALVAGDQAAAEAHAQAIRDLAVKGIRTALATPAGERRMRARLTTHIVSANMAPPRIIADLRKTATVIEARDALAAVARKLPKRIAPLEGKDLLRVKQILREAEEELGEAFVYALLLVMKRPFPGTLAKS